MQLQTLENNINSQVDEFLKVLAVSHVNIQPKFLEIQRNNEELRKIKDYILEANLQSNTFTYKKILDVLNIKSIDEINKIDSYKKETHSRFNSESHLHSVSDKNDIEETKELHISQEDSGFKWFGTNSFSKPEMLKKSAAKEKANHVNDFEDDDFKFNMNKITQIKQKEEFSVPDKKRTVSSSALEGRLTPSFWSQRATIPEGIKRFKLSETSTLDSSRINPFFASLNPTPQIPSLPFLPNLQVDSDLVCQMLIRKLAANGGLNDLVNINNILPDTFLNRARSNTE